jgi:nucleosome assembly protein 1-like 1
MTETAFPSNVYPKHADDIESEKEIVEAIKKISPSELKVRIFAVNHNVLKLKVLENAEQEEISKVDMVGSKTFQEHQKELNDLINGARKPTEVELATLSEFFTAEELANKDQLFSELKPLPDYWLTCFKNHGMLKSIVTENDEKAVKALRRVEYKVSEDTEHPLNFTLNFHFDKNDYFENEVLSVTLHISEPREASKIDGTDIKWKEGKDLTKKQIQKKQKNKKTGQTRTVNKVEDCDSFFNFFKTLDGKECDHKHEEDDEEGGCGEDALYENVETAYSVFEEVIPYSLEYFLGVRKDFGGEEGDEGDEGFEDGDDDEDDDPKPAAKKGAKPPKGAKGDPKQECKQQ